MLHATTMKDGSLALTELVPLAIRFDSAEGIDSATLARLEAGGCDLTTWPIRVPVIGTYTRGAYSSDGPPSFTVGLRTALGDGDTHVAALRELEADSLAPAVIEFPDMDRDVFAKWHPDLRGQIAEYHGPIDHAALPADRTFRDAWRHNAGTVAIDMPTAREIHKSRLRLARAPLLAALDVSYSRADAKGDAGAKAAAEAQRQALRDLTADPAIAAATTPDALKAAWPAVLSGPPALIAPAV